MPTLDWLRTAFNSGFDSGNVASRFPNRRRRQQERKIGGSYREVYTKAILPHLRPSATVLELGPGKGSWSRAILERIPQGRLFTADYVDLEPFLQPERYEGRLVVRQVHDNSFSVFEDEQFDFFFSFGVLCHNPAASIQEILANALPKMKHGATAVHEHGDWEKLDAFGWDRGHVPLRFKDLPDEDIWWPRNTSTEMAEIARAAGWDVVTEDLELLSRDGLICLRRP